jgi:hypothetical protein
MKTDTQQSGTQLNDIMLKNQATIDTVEGLTERNDTQQNVNKLIDI